MGMVGRNGTKPCRACTIDGLHVPDTSKSTHYPSGSVQLREYSHKEPRGQIVEIEQCQQWIRRTHAPGIREP
jgi:hypothetical protein